MNRTRLRRLTTAFIGASALMALAAGPASAAPGNGQSAEHHNSQAHGDQTPGPNDNPNGNPNDNPNDNPNANATGNDSVTEEEDDTDDLGESRHPSGMDRTDHQDKRQGNSPSDPDGDGRGPDRNDTGVDKPGEDGGVYTGDQDGNNGCGNDQDFEDDNEGWCGQPDTDTGVTPDAPPTPPTPPAPPTTPTTPTAPTPPSGGEDVGGGQVTTDDETDVLGVSMEREEIVIAGRPVTVGDDTEVAGAPDALATTGLPLTGLAIAGLGSVVAGLTMTRRRY